MSRYHDTGVDGLEMSMHWLSVDGKRLHYLLSFDIRLFEDRP